jgi:hypothetical protein
VTEALRTLIVGAAGLAAWFAWQSLRVSSIPSSAPERLVGELRLAQSAALLLALSAGSYVGIAAVHESQLGVAWDVALALGFFVVAVWSLVQDPRTALWTLALAFAAHAVLAIAHRPGLLPAGIVPTWFTIGSAVYDVSIGALCYLPMLRRP